MFWSGSWRPRRLGGTPVRSPTRYHRNWRSEVTEKPSLQVLSCNLLLTENGAPHHTAEFDLMERVQDPRLVVRRGQPFAIQLALNRGLQPELDAVSFIFTLQGKSLTRLMHDFCRLFYTRCLNFTTYAKVVLYWVNWELYRKFCIAIEWCCSYVQIGQHLISPFTKDQVWDHLEESQHWN